MQTYHAARLKRRFELSPVDALFYLIVGCHLRCQISVWLNLNLLASLRITVVSQRWPARWGYVRGLRVHADMLQNLPHLGVIGNESDESHLATAQRTKKWIGKHLFGVNLFDQAPPDKGTQDAPAQVALHFSHDCLIDATGGVKTKFRRTKNHARRCGLGNCISTYFAQTPHPPRKRGSAHAHSDWSRSDE
jgi:hypothetical protein